MCRQPFRVILLWTLTALLIGGLAGCEQLVARSAMSNATTRPDDERN